MSRVAAIGIDAAEWAHLVPLMDAGELPHLAALRERSAFAPLSNTPFYRAEIPWTQFLTGQSAQTSGLWGNVGYDPATYEVWQGTAHRVPPFYALGEDTKVVAFDVPQSVLDPQVHGVQVLAWGAHSAQFPRTSVPEGLIADLDRRFGTHPAQDKDHDLRWHQPEFVDGLADALVVGARRRADIAVALLEEHPDVDLFLTVLSELHSAGQELWHAADPQHLAHGVSTTELAGRRLLDVHRAVDEALGRILAALPDDTTVVVYALHGMQANDADVPSLVLLPELLHRLDTGEARLDGPDLDSWRRAGFPAVPPNPHTDQDRLLADLYAGDEAARRKRALRKRVPSGLMTAKRVAQAALRGSAGSGAHQWDHDEPGTVETGVDTLEVERRRTSLDWQMPAWYRDAWPRMRAFAMPTFSDGLVRLNVKGREAHGTVDPADYQAECDRVRAELLACRDPRTGEPVVTDVFQPRPGPDDAQGPPADLVVIWKPYVDSLVHPTAGLVGPVPVLRTGSHTPNGFLLAAGPGIEPGELPPSSALDVTPTILELLGRPPRTPMDGRPLVTRAPQGA